MGKYSKILHITIPYNKAWKYNPVWTAFVWAYWRNGQGGKEQPLIILASLVLFSHCCWSHAQIFHCS